MNAAVDEHYWDVYLTASSDNGSTGRPIRSSRWAATDE